MTAKPRAKKCKECGEKFKPWNTLQACCSPKCALAEGKRRMERKEKQKLKLLKESLKTRGQWVKEAQAAFNAYIRERDYKMPCISCDKPHDGSHQRHASHYRSAGGNPSLRFNTKNVHASCAQCNNHKSGNLIDYRVRLIKKIGQDAVDYLEGPIEAKRYDINYLKRIKKIFNKKQRILVRRREATL
jgi:5-methylcytosine-specific restriction endonuclease McrA